MPEPRPCALLLSGAQVVTVDDERTVHADGSVAVDGNRIVDVGPAAEVDARWHPARTVDCRGRAILPGLTDAHTHLFQSLARGIGDGLPIWPWLNTFMWPYSVHLDAEDAVVAARLGAVEAARAGITTVVDHHYAPSDPDTVMAVADAILSQADLTDSRNTVLVAVSLGIGFLPTAYPQFAEHMPTRQLQALFDSGIVLGTLAAVFLNLFFHHLRLPRRTGTRPPDAV
jgi:cytosine/adenosine deaminase-related metal-dependent hydrolase